MGNKLVKRIVNKTVKKADEYMDESLDNIREEYDKPSEELQNRRAIQPPTPRSFGVTKGVVEDLKSLKETLQIVADKNISLIENVVFKRYQNNISEDYIPEFPAIIKNKGEEVMVKHKEIPYEAMVRGLIIKKMVISKEEMQLDKVCNILGSLSDIGNALALAIRRTVEECTLVYIVKTESENDAGRVSDNSILTLKNVFEGNFPGSQCIEVNGVFQPKAFQAISQLYNNPLENIMQNQASLI